MVAGAMFQFTIIVGVIPAFASSFTNSDNYGFRFQLSNLSGTIHSTTEASSYVSNLLDMEQSKGMANRALFEEDLLTQAEQSALTMADEKERKDALKTVKKLQKMKNQGKGSGGGFGGAPKKRIKSSAYNPRLDKDGFGAILISEGVARIDNVMTEATVDNLRVYINEILDVRLKEATHTNSDDFARVLLPKNRWDLLLPLDEVDPVMEAMDELIGDKGSLNSILESLVGKDARLYEMACLVSDPGSERQVIHPGEICFSLKIYFNLLSNSFCLYRYSI